MWNDEKARTEAAETAHVTANDLAAVLATAAQNLEDEYTGASDTVAQAVAWQLRAAARDLEGASSALSDAFGL